MGTEKIWNIKQSTETKGMWFMMENDLIIKIKYGVRGKRQLESMVKRRRNHE